MESGLERTACLIWTLWDGFQTNIPPLSPSHAFFRFQTLMSCFSAAAVMYLFLSAWPPSAKVPLSWHPKWSALPVEQMRDRFWTVSPDGKLRTIACLRELRQLLENGVGRLFFLNLSSLSFSPSLCFLPCSIQILPHLLFLLPSLLLFSSFFCFLMFFVLRTHLRKTQNFTDCYFCQHLQLD